MQQDESHEHVSLCESANYQIKVQGKLVESWGEAYDDLVAKYDDKLNLTTMNIIVRDQSELFGLLQRLNNMALPLVSVECRNPN